MKIQLITRRRMRGNLSLLTPWCVTRTRHENAKISTKPYRVMKILSYILLCGLFFLSLNCQRNVHRSLSAGDTNLIGKWGIYRFGNLSVPGRCNSCPKIDLRYDSTGVVYLAQGINYAFKWAVYGDSINIVVDSAINDRLHLSEVYSFSITRKTAFTELLLKREVDKDFIKHFLLRKQN